MTQEQWLVVAHDVHRAVNHRHLEVPDWPDVDDLLALDEPLLLCHDDPPSRYIAL
jgi:hypothetical protein